MEELKIKTGRMIAGGFPGAGKSVLLHKTAKKLKGGVLKVGLIVNDRASELVGVTFCENESGTVKEVS